MCFAIIYSIQGVIKANITREDIINLALLQLNKPYIHGDNGPNSFDCAVCKLVNCCCSDNVFVAN